MSSKIIDFAQYKAKKKREELDSLSKQLDQLKSAHNKRKVKFERDIRDMICPFCGEKLVAVTVAGQNNKVCDECHRIF